MRHHRALVALLLAFTLACAADGAPDRAPESAAVAASLPSDAGHGQAAAPALLLAATTTPALAAPAIVPAPTAVPARLTRGRRLVVLDPGHGGPEPGSGANGLVEKTLNLRIAQGAADLLRAAGYDVVLTRTDDGPVNPAFVDATNRQQTTAELQARIDLANRLDADLFVSIHNNGSASPAERGTEVWFNALRTFSDRNEVLAQLLLDGILRRLGAAGHPTVNRGVKSDEFFRVRNGVAFNLYLLSPGTGPRPHEPTRMPAALGESLFLSNPVDAAALRRPEILQAIARGYADAIVAYFEHFPDPLP